MSESIQKKLLRVRPPRVKITYDVETGGALEKKELPFIVGILADLKGERDPAVAYPQLKARSMVEIDRDNFNDVMATIAPCASLLKAKAGDAALNDLLADAGDNQLIFSSMDAFDPLNVIQALPSLRALYLSRSQVRELQATAEASDIVENELDAIIDKLSPGVIANKIVLARTRSCIAVIDELVAQIDRKLSDALSTIMHCESFKNMEATWRGLNYLVMNTETGAMLKLRVFNATKDELRNDMMKAVEFDQSTLFKLIYEAEYGTFGGTPYSLLIGDYKVGNSGDDIDFISKMAEVAAAAHAPFIAQASEELFHLSGFDLLDKPRDLQKISASADMAGWQAFRNQEDARYVSLVLPRALLRLPYGTANKRNTTPCDGVNFDEHVGGEGAVAVYDKNGEPISYPDPDPSRFLWGNPAYLLGQRITNAFALYSWTAAIRGVEGGGLVDGLPSYTYTSRSGSIEWFCPTEVSITDRLDKELNDLGFISLCHRKGTGQAVFFGNQTTSQPKKYFSDPSNANAKMLPYMLAASRFAHYIKVMVRDKVGSFMTRSNVEDYLNNWISNYVLLDDNASQEAKAGYPLREARVMVTEVPGSPGAYRATIVLKPHFQLEELTTSIRMVANLPT